MARLLASVALTLSVTSSNGTNQQSHVMDYETFCQLPRVGRMTALPQISRENTGDLIRTHAQRWTDANRARLTATQLRFMQEFIATVPPMFREAHTAENYPRLRFVEQGLRQFFSSTDVSQFFRLDQADCVNG